MLKEKTVKSIAPQVFGDSHRYENENGEISLIYPCIGTGFHYEICCISGDLFEDCEGYCTLDQAEKRINELLKKEEMDIEKKLQKLEEKKKQIASKIWELKTAQQEKEKSDAWDKMWEIAEKYKFFNNVESKIEINGFNLPERCVYKVDIVKPDCCSIKIY